MVWWHSSVVQCVGKIAPFPGQHQPTFICSTVWDCVVTSLGMGQGIHELGLCCKLSTSLFVWNQSAVCRTCKSDPCVALSAHQKVTTTLHGAADKPKVHTTVVVTSTSKGNCWKNNFGYGTLCLVLHWCMYCCNHVHLGTIRINPINTHHDGQYLQRCGQADFWHEWSH